MSLVNREIRALASKTAQVKAEVIKIAEEEFGRKVWITNRQDELRLLTLLVWTERYKVSLRYILKAILPFWHAVFKKHRRNFQNNNGLGCKIMQLVGRRSEDLLIEKMQTDFPAQENFLDWRMKERIEQELPARVGKPKSLLKSEGTRDYVRSYAQTVGERQRQVTRAQANEDKKRWRYRDNPWL